MAACTREPPPGIAADKGGLDGATASAAKASATPKAAFAAAPSASASAAPNASASAQPSPSGCIVTSMDDSTTATLVGRLGVDATFMAPSGPSRPYILKLDAPKCVERSDEKALEVRVAPYSDAAGKTVDVKPFVGKRVEIGGFPMNAHTGWHARSVVVMTKSVRIVKP